ncbi:MAG: hypothetical protein GXO74_14060 [Calditrichaeota bacterium]|nr:hypothetical protein [Calditrichota bacterium]
MKDEISAAADPVLTLNKEIPGYSGYQNRNDLDNSDNQLRRYLSDKLRLATSQFNEKKDQLLSSGRENYREMISNILQSMDAVAESLKNPCYCSQGKIANNRLTQQQIDQLHDHDSKLVEQMLILEDEFTHLPDQFAEHELPDLLAHIYDLIDGFNQSLTEREFIFLGQEDEA